MRERPSRDLAPLVCLLFAGAGLPAVVLVVVGTAATWQAVLALIGAFAACYALLTLALSAPAPALIAVALLGLAATRGLWSVSRQMLRTRLAVRPLLALAETSSRLAAACEQAGADPRIVCAIPAEAPTSFCWGLLRRRIIVTSALIDVLSEGELAAVVAHEAEHARVYDPAWMLFARCASSAFFWLPLAADLRDRYFVRKELAADRAAIDRVGSRAFGSALLTVSAPGPAGTVSFGDGTLNLRVDALLGKPVALPPLSSARLTLTAVVMIAECGLVAWAVSDAPATNDAASGHAILQMLLSPTVHGLLGMALITSANVVALMLGRRVCGAIRRGFSPA